MAKQRSVLGGMIHDYMEKKRAPKRKAEWKKESLTKKMKDYDKYEEALKKRKGKKRKFSDREIDPKQIKDTRKKYKKLYGNWIKDKKIKGAHPVGDPKEKTKRKHPIGDPSKKISGKLM